MFSGGLGSFGAADRVIDRYGRENVTLLFTDTKIEDADLYRFLDDAGDALGVPVTRIADGRDIWQVFKDVRYLGNTRADPCSAILKREVARKWLAEHAPPGTATIYLGIDWTEEHRFDGARRRYAALGYACEAPLCEAPYVTKDQLHALLVVYGIALPRLYTLGFPHNNCGGCGCFLDAEDLL